MLLTEPESYFETGFRSAGVYVSPVAVLGPSFGSRHMGDTVEPRIWERLISKDDQSCSVKNRHTGDSKKREQRRERPFKTGEQTRELLAIPKGNIKAANIIQKEAFAEWDHCWNTDSEYKGSVSVFEWKLCLKIYYLRLALFANWQVYLWILFPLLFLSLSLPPWTCDLWKLAD